MINFGFKCFTKNTRGRILKATPRRKQSDSRTSKKDQQGKQNNTKSQTTNTQKCEQLLETAIKNTQQ